MASENSAGKQKGKTIETGTMTIRGHLLRLPNVVIQISNISGITVTDVQMRNPGGILLLIGLCLTVAGGFLVKTSQQYSYYYGSYRDEDQMSMGVVLFIIGVVLIIIGLVLLGKANRKCLNIYLNSGVTYSIVFANEEFMNQVLDVFDAIFEDGGAARHEYHINIKDCNFEGSSVINNRTYSR